MADERNAENVYLITMESSDGKNKKKVWVPLLCSCYPLMRRTISSLFTAFHSPATPFKRL